MSKVIMRQVNKYQWQIQNKDGKVIQDNLSFSHTYKAEEYVKAYISSFICWNYELVPLKEETDKAKNG